jgi:hypothetical protein
MGKKIKQIDNLGFYKLGILGQMDLSRLLMSKKSLWKKLLNFIRRSFSFRN